MKRNLLLFISIFVQETSNAIKLLSLSGSKLFLPAAINPTGCNPGPKLNPLKSFSRKPLFFAMAMVAMSLFFLSPAFAYVEITGVAIGTQTGTATYGTNSTVTYTITVTSKNNGGGTTNKDDIALTWTTTPAGVTTTGVTVTPPLTTFTPTVTTTTITLTIKTTGTTTQAGAYPFTITVTDVNDANKTYTTTQTLTVAKAPITLTANNQTKAQGTTFTFAGTEFTTTGTFYGTDGITTATLTSTGAAAGAAAGTYTIVPSAAVGSGLTNYNITYANGTMTVTPYIPNISYTTPDTYTAGNVITPLNPTNTGGTAVSYAAPTLPAGLSINTTTGVISGTPTTAVAATNYAVTATNTGGTSAIFYINITVIAPPAPTISYSGTPYTFTYGTSVGTKTPTVTNTPTSYAINPALPAGLAYSTTTGDITGTPTTVTAGTLTYTVSATNAGGTGTNTISVTINPAPLTITAKNETKTYGSAFTFTTTEFTTTGTLYGTDAVTSVPETSTGAAATATVGGYPIIPAGATGSGLSNYNITYVNGTLTVNTAAITITATSFSKVYGILYTFAGTEFTVTTGTFYNGDGITSVTFNTNGAVATAQPVNGPYGITITGVTGTGLSNYNITYKTGVLTVTKAPLTITGANESKIYGTTFNFTTTEFTTSGLVNTDGVASVTLTSPGAVSTAAAGTYAITPSAANASAGTNLNNYTITYSTAGILTCSPAPLTITANNLTITQGVTPTFSVSYSGFVNGDSNTNLTTQPTVTSTGGASSPQGTYPITASGAVDPNYTFTYVGGTLTIGPAGPNVYDWTGAVSTAWNNPANWQIAGAPQTVVYPGSSSVGDYADIGVNSSIGFTNTRQPIVTTTNPYSVGTITFGANNTDNINTTLTVTGVTLAVSGTVIEDHSSTAGGITTTIAGTGTLTCSTFTVGDNETPPGPSGTTLFGLGGNPPTENSTILNSSINTLNINGNLTLNSTSSALSTYIYIGFGIYYLSNYSVNNPVFNLTGGVATVNNIITSNAAYVNNNDGAYTITNSTTYNMDIAAAVNTLNLLGATPITAVTGAAINFVDGGTVANSTVNYEAASGTQKVYNSADTYISTTPTIYPNLTLSAASAKTVDGTALTIGGNWNTSGGTVNLTTNNPTVAVTSGWTNSTTVNQGSGTITVTGALTNNSGGTLALGTGNLLVAGNYSNNAGGVYTQSTGTTFFNGTTQALTDNSTAGTTFNNVEVETSGVKTMSGTGGFYVTSTGVLTMAGSASLAAGGVLTLISDVNGSATVAAIPTTCSVTGNVNVQRFITGGAAYYRGYRLLSSSVNAGGGVYSINYLQNSCWLTATTGASDGFDGGVNPTLYLYRENIAPSNATFTSGNFRGINNILSPPNYYIDIDGGPFNIFEGDGYLFYFRGDKSVASFTTATHQPYPTPTSTTLTETGTLNQGKITVKDWYTPASTDLGYTTATANSTIRGYNLVGNPYPSSINWDLYSTTSQTTGIYAPNCTKFIYVLDPVSSNYNVYEAGDGGVGTLVASGSNIIPSGQGFFVQAKAATAQLIFNEAGKTNTQATQAKGNLLMAARPMDAVPAAPVSQLLHLMLNQDSLQRDGIIINFNSSATALYNPDVDAAHKVGNGTIHLASLSSDSVLLSISTLALPKLSPEVIRLNVEATSDGVYQFNMATLQNIPAIYDIWLMDAFQKDSLDIKHNPTYSFSVLNANTATFGPDRFTLVIRENPALMFHLLSFTAAKATEGAQVLWTTENEANYTNFTVQRSTDNGATYNDLDGLLSSATGTYGFLDKDPVLGANMYRLKIVDLNGAISYSSVVTLMYTNTTSNEVAVNNHLMLYPNPTAGNINLTITNQAAASNLAYNIEIVNNLGAIIQTAKSASPVWQTNVSSLIPGTYYIYVVDSSNNNVVGRSAFIKL